MEKLWEKGIHTDSTFGKTFGRKIDWCSGYVVGLVCGQKVAIVLLLIQLAIAAVECVLEGTVEITSE